MADTNLELLFGQAPAEGLPVELVFGADEAPVIPLVLVGAAGRITGLRQPLRLRAGVRATASGRITGLRQPVRGLYNVNVQRPLVARVTSDMQQAQQLVVGTQLSFQGAQPYSDGVRSRWTASASVSSQAVVRWDDALRMQRLVAARFQQAQQLPMLGTTLRFENTLPRRVDLASRFQQALQLPLAPNRQRFEEALRRRAELGSRWQQAGQIETGVATGFGVAVQVGVYLGARFQNAWPPRPGISQRPEPPKPEPCYVPGLPIELLFDQAADSEQPVALVFVCGRTAPPPGAVVVVPIRRTYVTTNNITLTRLDTGAELHAHGFGMSLDEGSWTWSWDASLHHDAAGHLGRDAQGDPAELVAMVNGLPFRLRLERVARDRRFNPTRWAVGGRGRAAVLSDPHAPAMSFGNPATTLTARQLMESVLTINGVSIGWGVDWGLEDWTVPAGAWALRGTYIDALNDIAGAAGGYVQPHATDAVFRVLPRYPVAPWLWSGVTPAFEIPAAAAEVEGIEYLDKPAYNSVFVGGTSVGVFGPFKRTGTAGDVLAQQATHALITDAPAHRQRGLAVIADTGRQEHVTLSMQVLPSTGVITPGQFVRYLGDKTYMGIVRSTRINWQRPRLRQELRIETHA